MHSMTLCRQQPKLYYTYQNVVTQLKNLAEADIKQYVSIIKAYIQQSYFKKKMKQLCIINTYLNISVERSD